MHVTGDMKTRASHHASVAIRASILERPALWNRCNSGIVLCNISDGKYLTGFAEGINQARRDAESLRCASEIQKIKDGIIQDKIIQTRCTWRNVHHGFSIMTDPGSWGAWSHVSALDDRA